MERLDRFMARANALYYATHDPFADFTTAPEISQVFGEIIGLWAALAWVSAGSPDPVLLTEAGPGRGTLMRDVLRAARHVVPAFVQAARVQLIETSPALRAAQADIVPHATWHDSLETVPDAPMILLANEFLDALPIRQFVRRRGGWTERFVADGAWLEQPSSGPTGRHAATGQIPTGRHAATGQIIEVNEVSRGFVKAVAARVVRHPGAALFIDYGPMRSAPGDSLQAIADKRMVPPLGEPGSADLTAHVDFADLAKIARAAGAMVKGPATQAAFLLQLGLFQRTEALAGQNPGPIAQVLRESAMRLVDPKAMGDLFKVMAVASPKCARLPWIKTA